MKKLFYIIKDIIFSYLFIYLIVILTIILSMLITNDMNILSNLNQLEIYLTLGITLSVIPITLYLLKKYYHKENKVKKSSLILMIILGISISLFYNMLTINLTNPKTIMTIPLIITIIYTGIIGPVFEEILFRYITLKKAIIYLPWSYAILFTSFLFAIIHNGLITITYAFILGLILSLIYKKYQNIIYPIVIHISANITSIFIKDYQPVILLSSSILLIITSILIYKNQKSLS